MHERLARSPNAQPQIASPMQAEIGAELDLAIQQIYLLEKTPIEAMTLLDHGHEVVIHARNRDRLAAARDLLGRATAAVVGDLSDLHETQGVARQVNEAGRMDAVIHNAGVYTGPQILPVNVVAPYQLTALRVSRAAIASSSHFASMWSV